MTLLQETRNLKSIVAGNNIKTVSFRNAKRSGAIETYFLANTDCSTYLREGRPPTVEQVACVNLIAAWRHADGAGRINEHIDGQARDTLGGRIRFDDSALAQTWSSPSGRNTSFERTSRVNNTTEVISGLFKRNEEVTEIWTSKQKQNIKGTF